MALKGDLIFSPITDIELADRLGIDELETEIAGKSTVTYTPTVTSGVELGKIKVDGTTKKIFAPESVEGVTVTQTVITGTELATITVDDTSTKIYAPEVTTSNVYSTNEQEVGTWIDGNKVYEKTQNGGISISANDNWYDTSFTGINKVISFDCSLLRDGESVGSTFNGGHIDYTVRNNILKIKGYNLSINDNFTLEHLIIRYTKTS